MNKESWIASSAMPPRKDDFLLGKKYSYIVPPETNNNKPTKHHPFLALKQQRPCFILHTSNFIGAWWGCWAAWEDHRLSENKITFTSKTKDGRVITIEIDSSGEEITVVDAQKKEIGSISLTLIDCDHEEYYKITSMYLDKQGKSYLCQGIGRQALQLHKKYFDTSIEASDNDGIVKDDGSHLTGDAPAFISQMRIEGLVRRSSYDSL